MSDSTPFAPSALLRILESSVSREASSQPALQSPSDGLALFTHACLLSAGFRLLGLSEDSSLPEPITTSSPHPLPSNWNSDRNGSYSFVYAHDKSSLKFLVRVNRLGPRTAFLALAVGDDRTANFDIVTKEFVSDSFFPYSVPSSSDITTPPAGTILDGFISESRMKDLATLIKINIVQKLAPGLVKAVEEESGEGSSRSQTREERPNLRDEHDPLRVPRPYGDAGFRGPPPVPAGGERPPGWDDEYDIMRGPRGYPQQPGGYNPLSIGADDLNPPGLGPNPRMTGPFFGEGGMGGMHPGPDHPMFGGGGVRPNPRAPPGSRYDPVGPGDYPPQGAHGGLRGPPRGPGGGSDGPGGFGGPPNPFSGFGSGDFI